LEFTYYDQTVDLLPEKYLELWKPRVVVSVSGGLDSAALLWLLCTYFPDIEKHIFTGDDANHPADACCAEDVVDYIKKQIPNHNIKSHDFVVFDDMDPEILEEVKLLVEQDPEKYKKQFPYIERDKERKEQGLPPHKYTDEELFLGKISKPLLNRRNMISIMEKHNCPIYLSGMTMNPPNDEMKRLGFYNIAEKKRNEDCDDDKLKVAIHRRGGIAYQPFARVNKLFVKGVFEAHGILEEIFPLTGSCTGGANVTKLWTEPCTKCFWCQEKHWAFGKY
tara:strand:- start:575 stop:1408 length:834 start_codon:yes stop_codon:yes gene_type:complete